MWTPGVTPSLRFLGTPSDFAVAINNAGQVTGQFQISPGEWRAAIYANGALDYLGTPGGIDSMGSIGRAINANGNVAGALAIGPGQSHAFVYENGQMRGLGAFSGGRSDAYGLNDAGTVVGTSLVTGVGGQPNTWRAFAYSGGALTELDLGGTYSIAWDINNAGQIVGEWGPSIDGGSHAFVFKDGAVTDLGSLGGNVTYALSINQRGDVVGHGLTGPGDTLHGFIYADGEMVDVNSLLVEPHGWHITRTSAINEARQIAGLACRVNNPFQCMPALLSPVPEPPATILWSGGLLLLMLSMVRQYRSLHRRTDAAVAVPR